MFTKQDVSIEMDKLYGSWVEERYLPSMNSGNPPPPPPPAPEGTSEDDYQFPPIYKIEENNISVRYQYRTEVSELLIFNSVCCFMMKLDRESRKTDKKWEIISVTDSVLTINRSSRVTIYSSKNSYDENVKFIKIKN